MGQARIVVGIDGSPESIGALRFAITEAEFRHAVVHVVSAFSYPHLTLLVPLGPEPPTPEQLQRDTSETIDRAIAEVAATGAGIGEVEFRRDPVDDGPAAALLAAAKGAELLVVGARGRGGFAGLRLGSVSQQCAQHSPCPIVIVPSSTSTTAR
jgi:nucleotide-binding universal stress UspA family protein